MNSKINQSQFFSMMIMLTLASFLGIGVYSTIQTGGLNSWLSVIIASILGLIVLYLFVTIFNYEKDLILKDKINKLFKKPFNIIINFIFIVSGFTMGMSVIFNLINFTTSQFLQLTPPLVVGLASLFVIIYGATKNVESISRTCFILVIINIILFLAAFLNLFFQIDFNNFFPILKDGIYPPFKGAVYVLLLNILPYYLLLCIPKSKINNTKKFNRNLIFMYAISITLMFAVVFTTIGVLTEPLAKIYQYPEYIVLKSINYFNFMDRIENIINIQWIFGLFFNLILIVYYIKTFFKDTKIGNKSILPIIIGSLIFLGSSLIFKNISIFSTYIMKYSLYYRFGFFLVMVLTTIKIKIKS